MRVAFQGQSSSPATNTAASLLTNTRACGVRKSATTYNELRSSGFPPQRSTVAFPSGLCNGA